MCDPVRSYLRIREDTVRCIVASLTDDSSNELADVSHVHVIRGLDAYQQLVVACTISMLEADFSS